MINNIKQKFIKSDDGYSYKDKVIDAYFIDNLLILKYSKGKYILNWTINFEFNNIFFSKIDNDKKVYELKYDMNTKECLSDNCNDIEENYNEIISILNKIFDSN